MNHQLAIPWDVDSNRHKGNPQSIKANAIAAPSKPSVRSRILEYLRNYGDGTLKEMARTFGLAVHKVSPRLSDLKAIGAIEDVSDAAGEVIEREDCAVVRIKADTL